MKNETNPNGVLTLEDETGEHLKVNIYLGKGNTLSAIGERNGVEFAPDFSGEALYAIMKLGRQLLNERLIKSLHFDEFNTKAKITESKY